MTLHLVLLALVAAGSIQATVTIVLLRRSELAQRKSEERYRSIVEDQTELICRFRPDMVLTFVNQAYCNCFGKTEAELIGKSFLTLLEEDQQQEIVQDVARLTPASPVARRRQRVIHSDGRTAWQDWTNRALFDDTGRLTEFQAVGRDITELVAAHDELRAVTSRLENVIESSPAVIYTCHPYGDFGATFVSGNVKRQLGYEPEAFTENPRFWIDNIHPDDVSRVKDGLSDLFTYGDHVHEYRFRHQSGFYRWMRDALRLTRDPEGNPTELFGTWVDITDRKYAEYAMMESEQRLELALEGGGLGLWDHHLATGRIVYDRRWAEMLGYDVDHIDQHVSFWGSLIHPDDLKGVVQAFNDHVLGEAPHYAVEHRLRTKSGEWKWIFSKGKVVRWDSRGNPSRITGTHLDISDRKRVEERLRESLDEKQVLLQEIHHRCKNNLQIMASLLDMQSGYVYDENCAKMLGEAQNRIWAMALVHEKLFESTGLASLAVRDYMANLIDELLASFGSEAAGISVHLDDTDARFDIETAVPVGLLTNELVTNAIKHAFPPGGKGEIRLGVRRCNDDRFELEVSDNGTGLPADMEQLEGASFGFRLIRTLVRQLRGDLEYRSENGAEFRIRFVGVGPRQKR
jgi:PAS domain S-box-containing protein